MRLHHHLINQLGITKSVCRGSNMLKASLLGLTLPIIVGCASQVQPLPVRSEPIRSRPPEIEAGVVPYVWEEPMIDVVDVPPGLDPEGHYYRRAHQAVVEVRQGQWQPIDDGRRYRTR